MNKIIPAATPNPAPAHPVATERSEITKAVDGIIHTIDRDLYATGKNPGTAFHVAPSVPAETAKKS